MKSKYLCMKNMPPFWSIIIFVIIYGIASLVSFIARLKWEHDVNFFRVLRVATICISAGLYSGWRVFKFFPYPNSPYGWWLTYTPWHYGLPLPKGSVHLNITDLLVIGVLSLCSLQYGELRFYVPLMIFLFIYIILSVFSTLKGIDSTKYWGKRFLIFIIIPFSFCPVISVTGTFICLIICSFICYSHLRDVLKDYPWNQISWLVKDEEVLQYYSSSLFVTGWPYSPLAVKNEKPMSINKNIKIKVLFIALICWWIYAIIYAVSMRGNRVDFSVLYVLIFIGAVVSIAGRLLFLVQTSSPISFWGRIFTGHLIIPKFDRVWIAPLVIALLTFLTIRYMPQSHHVAIPVTIASIFFNLCIAMFCPPSTTQWRYTGGFRLSRSKIQEKQMMQTAKNNTSILNTPINELFTIK